SGQRYAVPLISILDSRVDMDSSQLQSADSSRNSSVTARRVELAVEPGGVAETRWRVGIAAYSEVEFGRKAPHAKSMPLGRLAPHVDWKFVRMGRPPRILCSANKNILRSQLFAVQEFARLLNLRSILKINVCECGRGSGYEVSNNSYRSDLKTTRLYPFRQF